MTDIIISKVDLLLLNTFNPTLNNLCFLIKSNAYLISYYYPYDNYLIAISYFLRSIDIVFFNVIGLLINFND